MDAFLNIYDHLAIGFGEALTLSNLWYCFIGVFLGCLVGVLPGLGAMITISLLLPITYHLPPSGAMIMLAGVYFGSDYGGGTCSILLGVPGHGASAVDVLDGYPMAKNGRGGVALFMKTIASFCGSMVGIVLLFVCAPLLANAAMSFGSPEYFALMALGLVAASTVGRGSPLKSLAMMVVGLLLGTVGADINSGALRFTFGFLEMLEGIPIVVAAMGLFAITEVIRSAGQNRVYHGEQRFSLRDQLPTRDEMRRSVGAILRGAGLGSLFGALPGTSGGLTTFMAYSVEKRVSKHPEKFGEGQIEGIAAPEACNNAGVGTAFIPTLTLGIPGDGIMALMLGALLIQGIQPGPEVISNNPELFWGLIVSFLIGNVMLLILNIPLIGLWIRILSIPYTLLYPAIVMFTCIGVYSVHNSVFEIYLLLLFGVLGYIVYFAGYEVVPMLLGLVIGPLLEENFRRTLNLSGGDFSVYFERPISAGVLALSAVILVLSMRTEVRKLRGGKPA